MTVTINTLGTNSRQIIIDDETVPSNIIDAVNTCLTALGWTLIDTVTSGSRNCFVTKVYSAPNADATTTKYMILRYDSPRQQWYVSCCEAWNTVTNVATNECWYANRQILLPFQYSNCILYVFATARYACFMGTVRGEPSAWQGVFEFEREAVEDIDTKNVPCFGWTSSLTIGEPYGNIVTVTTSSPTTTITSTNNGYVAVGFATPRTKNGLTGVSAAGAFIINTGLGSYPPPKSVFGVDFTDGGVLQANNSHSAMLGGFADGQSYVWDSNKSLISNLMLSGYTTAYELGRIYGLKVTVKLGSPLDTAVVPVDANLFYSPTGSNTTHYLLGIHGGYNDRFGTGTNKLQSTFTTSVTSIGNLYQSVIVKGRFLYMATTNGFHKFDMQSQSFTYNILPAATYHTVRYDGDNTLYVANQTTTIWKINLTDDTNTTLTGLSVSVSGLALDDTYLYAAQSTSGTTVVVKKITLSSFTETDSWNCTVGTSLSVTNISSGYYDGNVVVAVLSSQSASQCRIFRIISSDGSISSITPSQSGAAAVNLSIYCPQFIDTDGINFLTCYHSGGASGAAFVWRKIRFDTFALVSELLSTQNLSYAWLLGETSSAGRMGSCEIPHFAGLLPINISYAVSNTSLALNRLVISDPRNTTNLPRWPTNSSSFDANFNTYVGTFATDNCRLVCVTHTSNTVVQYTNAFRNYNFNGAQSSNLLIAQ